MSRLIKASFLLIVYVNSTGFLFNKPNRIVEENRNIQACTGDIPLKVPSFCYQKVVEAKLNTVYPYYERKKITSTLLRSIQLLEKNLEKTKRSFMALDKISSDDNNSVFKSAISSSHIFGAIQELKQSYDGVQSNIDAINGQKEILDELDKAKLSLMSQYAGVDPLFEQIIDEQILKIKESGKQEVNSFMDRQQPLMAESSQLFDKYNVFVDNYNGLIDQDNENIKNFAKKNGMTGYENDFSKLLEGKEDADRYIGFLTYFSKSEPVYIAEPFASKADKKNYKYVSSSSPVRIFVDYKDTPVYDKLSLREKYFKLLKVEPFNSVTGVTGYSLYLEYVKLK